MSLLTFVHISDTHINPDPNYIQHHADYTPVIGARALVAELNALPFTPDFVLHTGDVAYDPDPDAYTAVNEVFDGLTHPIYYVSGNHDSSTALQTDVLKRDDPQPILHYTFEHNGVQIVVADSNGPTTPPAGMMTDTQLDWLREQCQPDDERPLIVATHHNPLKVGIPWLDDFMGIQNGDDFHAAILPARDRIRGVFFGHVHQNIDIVRDGILYSSCLSSWTQFMSYPGMDTTVKDSGAEPGYSIVTVTETQTFIRRCRFQKPTA